MWSSRLPQTATDWLKCYFIYRLKCSKAICGMGLVEIGMSVCHLPTCSAAPPVGFKVLYFGDVVKVLAIFSDGSTHQRREYSKAQINCRCMIRFIRSQPRASNCKIQKTLIQNIITLDKNYQWPFKGMAIIVDGHQFNHHCDCQ